MPDPVPARGFRFNGEISLGSILNFMMMLGAIMGFMLHYEHRMTIQEQAVITQNLRDTAQDTALATSIAGIRGEMSSIRTTVDTISSKIK